MRATPLPRSWQGPRVVLGPADPTRDDLRPCEYALRPSLEAGPYAARYLARIVLDDEDRALIASGYVLWLDLDGAEVPWCLHLTPPDAEVPR